MPYCVPVQLFDEDLEEDEAAASPAPHPHTLFPSQHHTTSITTSLPGGQQDKGGSGVPTSAGSAGSRKSRGGLAGFCPRRASLSLSPRTTTSSAGTPPALPSTTAGLDTSPLSHATIPQLNSSADSHGPPRIEVESLSASPPSHATAPSASQGTSPGAGMGAPSTLLPSHAALVGGAAGPPGLINTLTGPTVLERMTQLLASQGGPSNQGSVRGSVGELGGQGGPISQGVRGSLGAWGDALFLDTSDPGQSSAGGAHDPLIH